MFGRLSGKYPMRRGGKPVPTEPQTGIEAVQRYIASQPRSGPPLTDYSHLIGAIKHRASLTEEQRQQEAHQYFAGVSDALDRMAAQPADNVVSLFQSDQQPEPAE